MAYGYVLRSPHAHARIRASTCARRSRCRACSRSDRRRLGGGEIRHAAAGACRASAATARRCIVPHPALARAGPRHAGRRSGRLRRRRDASTSPRTRPSASPSITSRCRRSPRPSEAVTPGAPKLWADCADNECFFYTRRRQGRGRGRLRQGASRHAAEARLQPHHRGDDGAARLHRRIRRPARAATRSMSARSARIGTRADLARQASSTCPRTQLPRRRRRCRRQLRHEGQPFPGISRSALWASREARPAGQMDRERSEGMLTDDHDRDHVTEAELALDKDGKFLAMRVQDVSNIGAYLAPGGVISPTVASRRARRHLYDAGDLCRGARRLHQHDQHRPLSRLGPARGVLHHRAPDRQRRARDGHRPRRAAPPQHRAGRARCRSRPASSITSTAASSRRISTWRCTSPITPASSSAAPRREARGKLRGIGIANIIEQTSQTHAARR